MTEEGTSREEEGARALRDPARARAAGLWRMPLDDILCCGGCCELEADEPVALAGGPETAFCDAFDLISAGFARSPPVVLHCVYGPAARRALTLRPAGWSAQKWSLDEYLLPVDEDARRNAAPGFLILCVNGSFYLAALNDQVRLWLDVSAAHGGPGALPLFVGDELRVGANVVRVEGVPCHEEAREPDDAAPVRANAARGGAWRARRRVARDASLASPQVSPHTPPFRRCSSPLGARARRRRRRGQRARRSSAPAC